jgi:hypothetical protein
LENFRNKFKALKYLLEGKDIIIHKKSHQHRQLGDENLPPDLFQQNVMSINSIQKVDERLNE